MKYGICNIGKTPLRKEPNHKSELISEILYGETFSIVSRKKNWVKVIIYWDEYEGWVNLNQFLSITLKDFKLINSNNQKYLTDLIQYLECENHQIFPVCMGSNIGASEYLNNYCEWTPKKVNKDIRSSIITSAYKYLHSPYLWGGRSPFGIDCSGLTQMCYKLQGIKIKRDAWQQSEQGTTLSFIEESNPGDLAFFDDDEGKIIHVGILLKNNYIIHSHGKVRIDKIDQTGIFNINTNNHSHKLRLIKKIL